MRGVYQVGREDAMAPAPSLAPPGRDRFGWDSRRSYAAIVLFAVLATPACADPLVYATPCPTRLRIAIAETPKGFAITLDRPGDRDPGPFTTLDVNFAQVSRRLFFKARTAEGLIEFQGHARADALSGLFSDDRNVTRTIVLPLATSNVRCDPRPGGLP